MKKFKQLLKNFCKNIWTYLKEKKRIYSANSLLMITIFLAILIVVNLIVIKEDQTFDLTKNKRYSLSKETINLLKSIKDEIKVTAFFAQGEEQNSILQEIGNKSQGKIKVTVIDPLQKPGLAKQYQVDRYQTVIFESGDKKEITTSNSESDYASALLKLLQRQTNKIYFSSGHGEKSPSDSNEAGYQSLQSALKKNGYEVAELNMINQKEVTIPQDASLLIIGGPSQDFLTMEKDALNRYLDGGGKVLALLDPAMQSQEANYGLKEILEKWGISISNGVVIDPVNGLFGEPVIPTIQKYPLHQITQGLSPTFYVGAVNVSKFEQQGISSQQILETDTETWLETNLLKSELSFDAQTDQKGPNSLAVVSQKSADTQEKNNQGRIIVIGDSDFISNSYLSSLDNQNLFFNSVRWLLSQAELLNITPKESVQTSIFLSGKEAKTIFWTTVVGLPLLFAALGALIFYQRRVKRKIQNSNF